MYKHEQDKYFKEIDSKKNPVLRKQGPSVILHPEREALRIQNKSMTFSGQEFRKKLETKAGFRSQRPSTASRRSSSQLVESKTRHIYY